MLFIDTSTKQYTWHFGDKFPPFVGTMISLQADGDELDFIKLHFGNIPMSSGRIVMWFDGMALFIAHNLLLMEG